MEWKSHLELERLHYPIDEIFLSEGKIVSVITYVNTND